MPDDKPKKRHATKNGKAKVLSNEQIDYLFNVIKANRHAEKNTLIMQISFKLGLRAQEIALLRIHEVAILDYKLPNGFKVKDILVLPKSFTKGANAVKRSKKHYKRTSVRFSVKEFDKVVTIITKMAQSGADINPEDFYPVVNKNNGVTRELPIVDDDLYKAIEEYVALRLYDNPALEKEDPLIFNQKGRPYSPNSLQGHMALMLKKWTGVYDASSHSGRRTLATTVLGKNKEPVAYAQKILGHVDAATTSTYQEVTTEEIADTLKNASETYKGN